jgi:hypothetical protein
MLSLSRSRSDKGVDDSLFNHQTSKQLVNVMDVHDIRLAPQCPSAFHNASEAEGRLTSATRRQIWSGLQGFHPGGLGTAERQWR